MTGIWFEHKLAITLGGDDSVENLALTCPMCNRAKNNMTLAEFLEWLSHIRSNEFKCFAIEECNLDGVHRDRLEKPDFLPSAEPNKER